MVLRVQDIGIFFISCMWFCPHLYTHFHNMLFVNFNFFINLVFIYWKLAYESIFAFPSICFSYEEPMRQKRSQKRIAYRRIYKSEIPPLPMFYGIFRTKGVRILCLHISESCVDNYSSVGINI
jgi:hypothetical protein